MLKGFNLGALRGMRNPRVLVRVALGVLLAANLIAAFLAFRPLGGSPEELRGQEAALRRQVEQLRERVKQSRALVEKVSHGRDAGDQFLDQYTTDRRTTFSTIVAELEGAAREAGIKPRPLSITLEPVEGSDTLMQMTISAGYEGTYASLTKFVHLLDQSPRFLIIESMTASPIQSGPTLSVSIKLDAFVRERPGSPT